MAVWFVTIALLGLRGVLAHPEVLAAIDPRHAAGFLVRHGAGTLLVLGGVFLAITGGEALYADMGHIGRFPIRLSWYGVVLPALLLSYAGQGALLLDHPRPAGNPFFLVVPGWALYPMVALATAATIIASQAIITGAFSLTRQAMQLGWLPGLRIRQTSDEEYGQIYVPFVNWTMMLCTVALTIGFRSSDRLAGAYGTAVSTTMMLTTALLFRAMRDRWNWPLPAAAAVAGGFLVIDVAFFAANLLKIAEGGAVPLLLGGFIFLLMRTWRRGITAVRARLIALTEPPERFLRRLASGAIPRVPGTAVFLTRVAQPVPLLLVRHVAQLGAVQERIVSLNVAFEEVPRVPAAERVAVNEVAEGFWHVTVHFGFVEVPSLPAALDAARRNGCAADVEEAMYFSGHDDLVAKRTRPRLPGWRRAIFGFMYRNAVRSPETFALPRDRFLEIGRQVDI